MIYAIGDIHGQLAELRRAHALIVEDASRNGEADARVVHVGDLVDRGSDSRGVIEMLRQGLDEGRKWTVIRGNHDQLFLNFLNGHDGTDDRLRKGVVWQSDIMGGAATLESYAGPRKMLERQGAYEARARSRVPDTHRQFLESLPFYHMAEDYLFVHAGIRPGFPVEAQDEEDLMWIRNEFLQHMGSHGPLIVHGHTPVDEPTHYGNRINIDCGAGWGHALVPVVLDQGKCFALHEDGRRAVKAPSEYYQ